MGFAEPAVRLATALARSPADKLSGKNAEFEEECKLLQNMLQGQFVFVPESRRWIFVANDGSHYEMGTVAEGAKKLGILSVLPGNGYLTRLSVVFVDEPEASLHPDALYDLIDVLWQLAHSGGYNQRLFRIRCDVPNVSLKQRMQKTNK